MGRRIELQLVALALVQEPCSPRLVDGPNVRFTGGGGVGGYFFSCGFRHQLLGELKGSFLHVFKKDTA